MITTEEQVKYWGVDVMTDIYRNKIYDLEAHLEYLSTHNEFIFRDMLRNDDKTVEWCFIGQLEANQRAEQKLLAKIRQYKLKLKIINNELKESDLLIDLESIKKIPCENFLGQPGMSSSQTLHFKAPWREETQASVVVYKRNNKFYDFGDPDKHGSVIDLVMLLENLEFKEAIKYLKNYI